MAELAKAIAARYKLPVDAIAQRMSAGRFRVKANIELDVATRFAADLETLGAICSVVDADTGAPHAASAALAAAPVAAPPVAAPPAPVAPPGLAPPAPMGNKAEEYQSGLSAAFNLPEDSRADIGALSYDSGALALATLDGDVEAEKEETVAEAIEQDDDMFAPPEMAGEQELEIAVAVAPPPVARPPVAAPAPAAAAPATAAPAPPSMMEQLSDLQSQPPASQSPAPVVAPPTPAKAGQKPAQKPLDRIRGALGRRASLRFATGVFLALLLGFIPAHLFAALREGSAYDSARADVSETHREYSAATTPDELEAASRNLEQTRRDALSRMQSTQSSIAVLSLLIWAGCGLGLGWVWFARLDWDSWS